jgi:hypothetical protein
MRTSEAERGDSFAETRGLTRVRSSSFSRNPAILVRTSSPNSLAGAIPAMPQAQHDLAV